MDAKIRHVRRLRLVRIVCLVIAAIAVITGTLTFYLAQHADNILDHIIYSFFAGVSLVALIVFLIIAVVCWYSGSTLRDELEEAAVEI